ncbi:MAG: putative F420-dependent oxidoreductase [Arenicella sp.]|jgi:probable F420-dependent oxidoreductase
MKFWQSMSFQSPEDCVALAQSAELAGFDGVSIAEHIFYPKHLQSKYPYTEDDSPTFEEHELWPEIWTTSAAMAAVTKTLRFSSSVSILPLQNPFQFARVLAALARLSSNRISVGAGAGWMKEEFAAFGIDFSSRGRRYDEVIELMRLLWRGQHTSFQGEFFQCDEVLMLPSPSQPIPIWIGGKSKAALRRAATVGDGWLSTGEPIEETLEIMSRLQSMRKQAGRDHLPFEAVAILPFSGIEEGDIDALTAAGITAIKNWTFRFVMEREEASLVEKQDYLASQARFIQRHRA